VGTAFRHEALLYDGEVGFLTGTLPFIREGVAPHPSATAAAVRVHLYLP
jgi:hypothetical protein